MRTRLFHRLAAGGLCLSLACCGCGRGGRDVFPEAESLERAGKLEEAAAKLDLACPLDPDGPRCGEASARAFDDRMKAAEAEIDKGHFIAADRLFRQAVLTSDDAGAKRVTERLSKEDLTLGLIYEHALTLPDRKRAALDIRLVAAGRTPAAARAKEWLATEGPALLAQAVRSACGPEHEGSCTEAFAKLQASGAKGPDADEATRAFEAEQRRVYPLRTQGESFVRLFASQGQKEKAFVKCQVDHADSGTDPVVIRSKCDEDVFGTDPYEKAYRAKKNNDNLFRRLLKNIADPALAADLEARKARALSEGEAPAVAVPKPAPRSP